MKVGVNLLWLRAGIVGGSEEYLVRQLTPVPEVAPDIQLVLFAGQRFAAAHPALTNASTVVVSRAASTSRAARIAVENTWLARAARRHDVDLLHHGGGTVPTFGRRIPVVLTIHDLQYRTFPQYFSAARLAYLRATMARSARRADAIYVPSAFVAASVVDAFAVAPDRVFVVPHGLVPAPPNASAPLPASTGAVPERPFVVYPAITHPHKNHVTLLRALARVDDLDLVLLGGRGRADAEVGDEIARLGLAPRVRRPGRVPDTDRDALYASARALAFPSRYEGFGAPVIEAMAAGCPVVAANTTALPEVVADAGALLPPDDVEAWAGALARLRDDEAWRGALAAAGRARAAHFTAAASASALVRAYRAVQP